VSDEGQEERTKLLPRAPTYLARSLFDVGTGNSVGSESDILSDRHIEKSGFLANVGELSTVPADVKRSDIVTQVQQLPL
jgi:hypothetical protein